MGLLSRLKELFSKKSLETFKEIEEEFNKLQKRLDCDIIALIGTSGKPKGLPLIYISSQDEDLRRNAANLTELMTPLRNITGGKEIKELTVFYDDKRLFFKPLMEDISFFALIKAKSDVSLLREWINDKISDLKEVFRVKDKE